MNNVIFNIWTDKKDNAVSNASIAKNILKLLFVLQVLNLAINAFSSPISALINFIILFTLYFFIKEDVNKDFENLMADEFAKEINPETFNPQLGLMMNNTIDKFNIDSPIKYYVSVNNFDYSPHVFSRSKVNFLVLPLGFFKLLTEAPEEARAILAHELSHIAQYDSNMTILVKVFLKYVFSIILPLQILLMSPILYYSYQESREYREEAENFHSYLVVMNDYDYYQKQIDENTAHARQSELIFWVFLVSIIILFFIYRYFRSVSYRSESTADIGAASMTSLQTVKRILERVLHDRKYKKRKVFWFTVNPSIKWRLNKLEKLEKQYNLLVTKETLS